MLYKELYINGEGIFEAIFKKLYPDAYEKIFITADPKNVDTYALINYGNKKLIDVITIDSYSHIVSSVINMNLYSWTKQAETLGAEYDILRPIVREIEEEKSNSRDETKTNDITNSKKYFNDGEFTDGQKETAQSEQGWQETYSRTYSEIGIGSSNSISGIIQKEIALRELNIMKKVIKQLVTEITIDIY